MKTHYATGLGIYCVFADAPIQAFTAVEQPLVQDWKGTPGVLVRHVTIVRFGGVDGSGINHVINDLGKGIDQDTKKSQLENAYVPQPDDSE